MASTLFKRFWAKVVKTDGCWEWAGDRGGDGYGRILRDCSPLKLKAHRISWEFHNGPIPDGLCVCHKCDNPPCVNPDHLFLGTKGDNNRDMCAKGRARPGFALGEAHAKSRLTDSVVVEIRAIFKIRHQEFGVRALARRFGVSESAISQAISGRTWGHIQ